MKQSGIVGRPVRGVGRLVLRALLDEVVAGGVPDGRFDGFIGVAWGDDEAVGVFVGGAVFPERYEDAGGAVASPAGAPEVEFFVGRCSGVGCDDACFPVCLADEALVVGEPAVPCLFVGQWSLLGVAARPDTRIECRGKLAFGPRSTVVRRGWNPP